MPREYLTQGGKAAPPSSPPFVRPPPLTHTHTRTRSLEGPLQEARPQEPLSHPHQQKLRPDSWKTGLWPRGPSEDGSLLSGAGKQQG